MESRLSLWEWTTRECSVAVTNKKKLDYWVTKWVLFCSRPSFKWGFVANPEIFHCISAISIEQQCSRCIAKSRILVIIVIIVISSSISLSTSSKSTVNKAFSLVLSAVEMNTSLTVAKPTALWMDGVVRLSLGICRRFRRNFQLSARLHRARSNVSQPLNTVVIGSECIIEYRSG